MAAHDIYRRKNELTVNEVKGFISGNGIDKETRESLRILAQKGIVEVKKSGSSTQICLCAEIICVSLV